MDTTSPPQASDQPGDALPPPLDPPSRSAELAFSISVVATLVLVGVLYVLFPQILAVLLLSGLLSYALLPVVDRLERSHLSRTIAVLLVALLGVGLLVLAVVLLAPTVAAELQRIPEAVQKLIQQAQGLWGRMQPRLPQPVVQLINRLGEWFTQSTGQLAPGAGQVGRYAGSAAAGIGAVASGLVLVPVFVFVMLRGYHPFISTLQRLVPPRWRPQFFKRTQEADRVLSGFIRGQLLVATILAVMYSVAFSIIGIPLAIVVGILAGFGELIPYVGNAIALVIGSLLALVGGQPMDVLWVIGSYAVIQGVQGALISPYIMGRQVHLSPVSIIVALAVGAQLLGLIGMLAAVPASALLKVAAKAAVSAYRESTFFRKPA